MTRRASGKGRARACAALAPFGLIVAAGTTHTRVSAAEAAPSARPVYVERSACESALSGEIAAILRVELLNRLADSAPPDAYRTAIDCAGDLVAISVTPPSGASKSRQANLAGSPANVRSRIVALAVAELVRDLDREPRPLPPPVPAPASAKDAAPSPPPSIPRRRAVELGAFGQTSSFQLDGVWLAGGGLRFDYVYKRLCAGFDVAALTTTERFEQGTAQAFLAYGSPFVAWDERFGRAQTFVGAGYALGVAKLSGQASDPRAFAGATTGPWSAPYGFAALALVVAEGMSVDARGQLGWVTSPVIGDVTGGRQVALEGLWASVQLGLAIAL